MKEACDFPDEKTMSAVIPIQDKNNIIRGSAVLISPTRLITAGHNADNVTRILKRDKEANFTLIIGGKVVPFEVEFRSKVADIAVLSVKKQTVTPIKIYRGEQKIGDKVWAAGYPGYMPRFVTSGRYQGKYIRRQGENDVLYHAHDVPVSPGNSGGALLGCYNGKFQFTGTPVFLRTAGRQLIYHNSFSTDLKYVSKYLNYRKVPSWKR